MVDATDLLANVPSIHDIMDLYNTPAQAAPQGGTGNWLTAGLQSGWYGGKAAVAQGLQEGARVVGANETADNLASYAKGQRDIAATYARPDLENAGWASPTGFAYHLAQSVPGIATALGGAAAATLALPEEAIGGLGAAGLWGARALLGSGALSGVTAAGAGEAIAGGLGGAAAMYPSSVGEMAQRALAEGQPESPGKALALGVPAALAQGVLPAAGESWLAGRVAKGFGETLAGKAAIAGGANAGAGAAGEALMQQMGDPNRSFAQRSSDIIEAALAGATQGAAFGGAIHLLAKKPASSVTNDDLNNATAGPLGLPAPPPPPPGLPGPPPVAGLLEPPHRFPPSPSNEPAPPKAYSGETIIADASPDQIPPRSNTPWGRSNVAQTTAAEALDGVVKPSGEPLVVNIQPGRAGVPQAEPPIPGLPDRRPQVQQPPALSGWEADVRDPQIKRPPIPPQTSGASEAVKAATTEQNIAKIKDATGSKAVLNDLVPHLGNTEDLQGAILAAAQKKLGKAPYQPGDVPDILGPRLTKIAKAFDVIDKDGNLVDPRPKADEPVVEPPAEEAPGEPPAATTNLGPETEPNPEEAAGLPPAKNRPDMDPKWSDGRKAAWKAAEKLHDQVPPGMEHLTDQLNGLQSNLSNPGKGGVQKIMAGIKKVEAAIKGHAAITDTLPPEAKPPEPAPKPVVDETKGATKFDVPEGDPNAVQEPSAQTVDGGKPPGDGEGVRGGDEQPATGEVKPPGGAEVSRPTVKAVVNGKAKETKLPKQDELKAKQAKPAEPRPADPGETGPFDPNKDNGYVKNHGISLQKDEATKWGASIAAQKAVVNSQHKFPKTPPGEELPPVKEGKPTGRPSNVDGRTPVEQTGDAKTPPKQKGAAPEQDLKPKAPAAPEKPTLSKEHAAALSKAMGGLRKNILALRNIKLPDNITKKVRTAFEKGMQKLSNQHDDMLAAIKSDDPYAALAKIKDDHFSSEAFDDGYDSMPKDVRKLLDENSKHIDAVLDQVNEINGDTQQRVVTPDEMFTSRVPNQMDRDLVYMIHKGMSARQILQHLVTNGSNSIRKTMAVRLLQLSKADPYVKLASQEDMLGNRVLNGSVYGDYKPSMDRIRISDMADVEHTLIHEFTHAATMRALHFDPIMRSAMEALYKHVYQQATDLERKQYGLKDMKEFVAEAFANHDFAHYLDSIDPPKGWAGKLPGSTVWRSFKELIRRTFGFPKGAETVLDHVMNLAGETINADNSIRDKITSAQGVQKLTGTINRLKLDAGDDILRKVSHTFDINSIPTRIFNKLVPWRTLESIRDSVQHLVPTYAPYVQHILTRKLRDEAFNSFVTTASNAGRALDKTSRDLVNKLMAFDMLDIDPRRNLAQHTWMDAAQKAKRASKIKEGNDLWNEAKRKGLDKVYELHNQASRAHLFGFLTAAFRDLVERDKMKITLKADPFDVFTNDQTGMKQDPRRSADFWQQRLNNSLSVARQYISHINNEIDNTQDLHKKAALNKHIEAISSWERDATRYLTASDQAPNFAFRRRGDHFVGAKLVDNVSPQQMAQFQTLLKRSGFDVQIEPNNENKSIYIRTFGETRAGALRDVMIKAEQAGILKKDTIKSGPATSLRDNHGVAPAWISRQIRNMRDTMPDLPPDADPDLVKEYNDARQHSMDQMTQQYLDLLPDSSSGKIFAEREGVQGADPDMMKAFEERALNASRGVANLSVSGKMAEAHKGLIKDVERVKGDTNMSLGQQSRAQTAVQEAFLREAQRNWAMPQTMWDGIRRITHLMELGVSVPYAITLASQVPTLTIPELGKHFGYAKSVLATAKIMPLALKAMAATFQGHDKWAFAMTPEKLKGLSQKDRDFLIHQNNLGSFNVSSFTQHIYDGLHHENAAWRKVHEISGAWSLYSEMFPRLVTALAARDLHEANPKSVQGKSLGDMHTFVADKVARSQFSWVPDTNPRMTGKHGVAGAASPLIAQFQNFHIKMLEKLHREFSDAFGARGDDYKSEARRFLLGHMAAQVAVAGTMGLPAVGFFAGLYDRLADAWTGEDTHDIRASYRKYLSDMMGDDVGEAMAHGVSRYAGIDLSEHLGEDRILPLTQLMSDKRKLEDSYSDWMKSLAGSAAHMGFNMLLGARDLVNGDTREGMAKMLPEALRGPVEGSLINNYGYEDKSGFLKPLKAETRDVVEKFLGLTPAKEANYGEKQRVVSGLREREEYDKQNILSHLAKSYNRHDPVGYKEWVKSSEQFQMAHPGQTPPIAGFGDFLSSHSRSAAIAAQTGAPVGTLPTDYTARGFVNYRNMQGN